MKLKYYEEKRMKKKEKCACKRTDDGGGLIFSFTKRKRNIIMNDKVIRHFEAMDTEIAGVCRD